MNKTCSKLRLHTRRGVALVLVISAIALAAVLGLALISGAMLQSRTSSNAAKIAQADYLAESGLNLALFYLQNSDKAPSLNGSGYWSGGTFTVGASPPLVMTITIVRDATDTNAYEVTSLGKVGNDGETQMSRTLQARANVQTGYKVKAATGAAGNLTVYSGTTIDGDIISPNNVVIKTGSAITGKVYSPGISLPVGYLNPPQNPAMPSDALAAPAVNDVNRYATYTLNGASGTAETIPAAVTTVPSASAPMNTNAANPGKVWVADGNLTINDDFALNGTLIVKGNLIINGKNINITPRVGMPGIIVIGNLQVNQTKKAITVNGVVYVGGNLKTSGVLLLPADASTLTINGGLLLGNSSTPISTGYNAVTYVKVDSTLTSVPDLSTTGRSPMSVSVKRTGSTLTAPY
jgi:Tfp pilus assembly protein PilX